MGKVGRGGTEGEEAISLGSDWGGGGGGGGGKAVGP